MSSVPGHPRSVVEGAAAIEALPPALFYRYRQGVAVIPMHLARGAVVSAEVGVPGRG
jgi:hypothetical protein